MKHNGSILALIGLCIINLAFPIQANENVGLSAMNFLKINKSVKAEALGTAMTAINDIDAFNINPAAIANATNLEVNFCNLNYIEDINFNSISTVIPTEIGTFGLNIGYLDMGSQTITTYTDRSGTAGDSFSNYGYQLSGVYALSFDKTNVGVGLKYVAEKLEANPADAIGLDIGLNQMIREDTYIGIAVNNITIQKAKFVTEYASLPQDVRFGIMYKARLLDRPIVYSSDFIIPDDNDPYLAVGLDYQALSFFHIRTGYSSQSDTLANMSAGLGIALDNLMINFTYKPYKDFGPTYRVGFDIVM